MLAVLPLAIAVLLPLAAAQSGDGDRRDQVELTSGEVRRGRVLQRHAGEPLVLMVRGQRQEIPHARVARVHTVADATAALLDLRRPDLSVAADWNLAESARDTELHALARLLAYHVLLRDPEHAGAHALLGHQGGPGRWQWRWQDDLVSAATFARRAHSDRFTLHSEHFTLVSRAGLRPAVAALLDLERTYAAFWRELGEDLRPRLLFPAIEVQVHPSLRDLPKLSTTVAEPYCDPSLRGGGVVHTFQEPTMERPARLAALAIEQLLYRTLLDPRAAVPPTLEHRIAPWIEIGLGRCYEARAAGKPGYLTFGAVRLDPLLAGQVLRYRPYGLEDLVQIPFFAFHDDPAAARLHTAHAAMFVAYLLDAAATAGTPPAALRPRFLAYVRACYRDGKGNSSSGLDAALGDPIDRVENLEAPWIAWLAKATGQPAIRQPHAAPSHRSLRARVLGPPIR